MNQNNELNEALAREGVLSFCGLKSPTNLRVQNHPPLRWFFDSILDS